VELSDPLDEWELIEDQKPYREWCVPARLINERGNVTLLTQEQLDDLARERWERRRGGTTTEGRPRRLDE
jgi:hypothetical protein